MSPSDSEKGKVVSSEICVAVAMHKKYRKPADPVYLPLHVGAALSASDGEDLGIASDDTGDNISNLNRYYSELTALYWLWKNSDAAHKGLVHYRRYFSTRSFGRHFKRDRMDRIMSGDEMRGILTRGSNDGVLTPKKRNYYIETVYSHYAHTMHGEQLDETRKVLSSLCPQYVPAFDAEMQRKNVHILNMFVMRADLFDKYCAFLFPVLKELGERIDPAQYDAFHARYLGRVSELLLDVWLDTNRVRCAEAPLVSIEPVNWFKKGGSFLAAKFFGKKYGKSF
ncbi:MAG: DUF4422 domain-containing protein [Bifidobacteriaceae bacterium]|nr:DUF4422 domain-containing protein [Bifidobacteriaceae bacterium]